MPKVQSHLRNVRVGKKRLGSNVFPTVRMPSA